MKRIFTLAIVIIVFQSVKCYALSDSLNPFTEKEILKLSNLIYELEKKDSIASANEPNGFGLKDKSTISDSSLLVDLNDDSIHEYTGLEVIKLSNYIFELEKRDSIRTVNAVAKEIAAKEAEKSVVKLTYSVQIGAFRKNPQMHGVREFHKYKKDDGLEKYLSGDFTSHTEAEERKIELLTKGIHEAYIVIFKDGKPIN
jgi:hypothetical protein